MRRGRQFLSMRKEQPRTKYLRNIAAACYPKNISAGARAR